MARGAPRPVELCSWGVDALWAWSGLLPTAKTGARRILMGLSLVCILAGLVLAILNFSRT